MEDNIEVLLSCMNQNDSSIIRRSNLEKANVLVINQCRTENDKFIFLDSRHRWYLTNTRGLSVSRNLAVDYAKGDYCVLADDDEVFESDLCEKIENAYSELKDADIIVFDVDNHNCKIKKKIHRLKWYELLWVSSVQITFCLKSIKGKVIFDDKIGSGTEIGAGEDNKFMLDSFKKGLKIYYYPATIASLLPSDSQWFKAYDGDFFYKDCTGNRYVMGLPIAVLYTIKFLLFKRKLYKDSCSFSNALKQSIRGLKNKDMIIK